MGFGGSLPKEFFKKIFQEKKKKSVSHLGFACKANSAQFGWEWAGLAGYLAGKSQTAPTIFFKLSAYIFKIISSRTHKQQSPSHF